MLVRACLLLFVATSGFAQQHAVNSAGGDRQVRLEDIERDNLSAQKATSTGQQQQQTVQYTPARQHQQQVSQQQLAAYQQQLLLQQLQNQYFAPTPLTYSNLGGVPLMIVPNNQLGVGQTSLPIQAYYIPQIDQPLVTQPLLAQPQHVPQFYHQPQGQVYIPPQRFQQPQVVAVQKPHQPPVQRLQQITQPSVPPKDGPFVPSVPVQQQHQYQAPVGYRPLQQQQYTFPAQNFVYNTPPPPQQQFVYNQPPQPYNTYNALYQQRPQKTTFTSGIKSTAAPPLKPAVGVASQQLYVPGSTPQSLTEPQSQSYVNYKSF